MCKDSKESIRLLLVSFQGGEELLHFGWWWSERGQLAGEVIQWKSSVVAFLLICCQGLIESLTSAKSRINRLHEQFGTMKRIGYAFCRAWVLKVAGISNQHR